MSSWRGHVIDDRDGIWYYAGTSIRVADQPNIKCGHCNKKNRLDFCDSCLGKLSKVMNACCGHGNREDSYVQFDNGIILREFIIEQL